jgi:DNA repair protein REV1
VPCYIDRIVCRVIMHVDMDCFFASVSMRNRPELQGVPLAVAYGHHASGHSEISCANYTARRFGVRAGMWFADAKAKCASTRALTLKDTFCRNSLTLSVFLLRTEGCRSEIPVRYLYHE